MATCMSIKLRCAVVCKHLGLLLSPIIAVPLNHNVPTAVVLCYESHLMHVKLVRDTLLTPLDTSCDCWWWFVGTTLEHC
jgi:hypothetical protein